MLEGLQKKNGLHIFVLQIMETLGNIRIILSQEQYQVSWPGWPRSHTHELYIPSTFLSTCSMHAKALDIFFVSFSAIYFEYSHTKFYFWVKPDLQKGEYLSHIALLPYVIGLHYYKKKLHISALYITRLLLKELSFLS